MSSSYPSRNDMPRPLCLRCGMVLPRNLYCVHCGYDNNLAHTDISARETQPAPTVTLFPGREPASTVTPFFGIAPDVSQIETRQLPINTTSYPPSYVTQPTLIVPVELQKERPPQASHLQRRARRKVRGRKILVGIILAIIVLVGGGFAAYAFFLYLPATQKSAQTATIHPATRPQGPLKFVDAFKNNKNQWDLQSEAGKYSVTITNGKLTLEDDNNSLLPEYLPGNRSFHNFKVTVDAMLSKGDVKNGYGLYIRCSSDQSGVPTTYYRFEIYGDGTYAIFKGIVDAHGKASPSPLKLVSYTATNAIQKQGHSNHIEIDAQGPAMTIRVNGQVLKTLSDPGYTKGTIALFISNIQNALPVAQATFANLTVYPS